MIRGGILSLVLSLFFYSILGYIVFMVLIGLFPFLAVILLAVIIVSALSRVITYFRSRISQNERNKKYDEFGNRRTSVTVLEVQEEKRDQIG